MSENGISANSRMTDTVILLINRQGQVLARSASNGHPAESLIQMEGDRLVGLGQMKGEALAALLETGPDDDPCQLKPLTLPAGDVSPVMVSLNRLSIDPASAEEEWLMLQLQPVEPEPDFSSHELSRCYRLTRTQAKILSALMRGLEPQAIALQYRITLPTVRTHLQHIREKLGCRKTSELILRVMAHNGAASLKTKNHQK